MVEPESRRALAFTVEPSGATTRIRQVINRTFELTLAIAALDADSTGSGLVIPVGFGPLVLRLNYSMEVARSSSSELAKIYGWRQKSNVYLYS